MAMGKRRQRPKQMSIWMATQDLPRSAAHPFYARLNRILEEAGFDAYVEGLCERFYANEVGRPGLPPGRYFRLLLIGYFEGLDAERAIAWRASDSLALREFLGLVLPEAPPDHSTISRTRRLIDLETHEAVFTWMLQRLADAGLVKGKTVGIDATTLEANAALRSIVRRDSGESYQAFLIKLARASGIETPTRADLARIDRKRKKKGANDDWTHPHDPDAKITKMKDGRTHLAHKAEHVVDLETGAIVGVTVQDADDGDGETSIETLITAAEQVEAVLPERGGVQEVVGDKGYHSNQALIDLDAVGVRSYISEPDRGRRKWKKKPEARAAVYRNRRRIRGARGLRLLRLRGERLERPFAHLYETGRMRRVHLRGHTNILKRLLIHTGGFNLGLLMRQLIGVGTPRSLQGRLSAVVAALLALIGSRSEPATRHRRPGRQVSTLTRRSTARFGVVHIGLREMVFTTGC
jgi:transposase